MASKVTSTLKECKWAITEQLPYDKLAHLNLDQVWAFMVKTILIQNFFKLVYTEKQCQVKALIELDASVIYWKKVKLKVIYELKPQACLEFSQEFQLEIKYKDSSKLKCSLLNSKITKYH